MRASRPISLLRRLWPLLLFFASLTALRLAAVEHLGLAWRAAFAAGLARGVLYDFAAVAILAIFAGVLDALLRIPKHIPWCLLTTTTWLAAVADLLYFKFFGGMLDLWIVRLHWSDLALVNTAASRLALSWPVALSGGLLAASIAASIILARQERAGVARLPGARPPRWQAFARPALALIALVALMQVRLLLPRGHAVPILSQNILDRWRRDLTGTSGLDDRILRFTSARNMPALSESAPHVLARLRDLGLARPPVAPDPAWPLVVPLERDDAQTAALRRRFGLPEQGPIHVLVLLLESIRAYELNHPVLGDEVFPALRALLAKHAVYFEQAYSSSIDAGQTVRGEFSTHCSTIPNLTAPATYILRPALRITCLASMFGQEGYHTLWFNAHRQRFHNKSAFSSLHGTQQFFDAEHFGKLPDEPHVGPWEGLSDKPFLLETARLLQTFADRGELIFGQALTLSSHFPQSVVPETPLTPILQQYAHGDEPYAAYLSTLRYVDTALASFFEAFFALPMAERTLVVIGGDHSIGVLPPDITAPVRQLEILGRVPIAFISKGMREPGRVRAQVHQADVAPTVAAIAGLRGDVTWLGRNLLRNGGMTSPSPRAPGISLRAGGADEHLLTTNSAAGELPNAPHAKAPHGTPWLFSLNEQVSYRVGDLGCYAPADGTGRQCYRIGPTQDPMYVDTSALSPTTPPEDLAALMQQVLPAVRAAVVGNLIAPPPGVALRTGRPAATPVASQQARVTVATTPPRP